MRCLLTQQHQRKNSRAVIRNLGYNGFSFIFSLLSSALKNLATVPPITVTSLRLADWIGPNRVKKVVETSDSWALDWSGLSG